jgi:hypothetical protein
MRATGSLALVIAAVTAAPACADLIALKSEPYLGDGWVEHGYDTSELVTWRLWANFDDPTDAVIAVYGISYVPLRTRSTDGLFHNSGGGLDRLTAPEDLRHLGIWENQWDTYVTLNAEEAEGNELILSLDFGDETDYLVRDWESENAGWYVTPGTPQSFARPKPGGGLGVLLAQFTVAAGERPFGTINLLLDDGQVEQLEWGLTPTPGAMALIGLAAARGARRRACRSSS